MLVSDAISQQQQYFQIQQWLKDMTYYGDSTLIANTQQTIRNMSVETGPFEGFFVCSVEFCKHIKFDDKDDRKDIRDRDNRTGRQGPPSPAGPQGPQGIQGPTGA